MKPILTILLFLSLSSSAQYRLRMIAQDDGGVNDTLYLKDNTDSLFRRVNSVYVFSEREKVKRFPAYWQLQGAPQGGTVDWPDITNKPSTFPASSHTHDWASDITGKPSTFTPSSHTHTLSDISNYDNTYELAAAALGSPFLAQTVGFPIQYSNTSSALTDGQIRYTAVYLSKSSTITGIRVYSRTAGNYTGDNNNRVGLYSYSSGTLTLVASSANTSNLWTSAANAYQTISFSSTYAAAPGIYFVALIYNNSAQTTAPALASGTALNNAAMASMAFTNSAKLFGTSTGTDLPASIAMSSVTASTAPTWVAFY